MTTAKPCLLLAALLAGACHAAPITYDGGTPDLKQGHFSDWNHPSGQAPEVADLFTAQGTVLAVKPTTLRWWGGYTFGDGQPDGADLFSVRLFLGSFAAPVGDAIYAASFDAAGAVTRNAIGSHLTMADGSMGPAVFEYSVTLDPTWTLAAGSSYWLAIQNDLEGVDDDTWFWATSNFAQGTAVSRVDYGPNWSTLQGAMAFQLTFEGFDAEPPPVTPVPEPAGWALVGAGLVALRATRRGGVQRRAHPA
jgi:hypothetical protein